MSVGSALSVCICADDSPFAGELSRILHTDGLESCDAATFDQALTLLRDAAISVCIVSQRAVNESLLRFLRELRSQCESRVIVALREDVDPVARGEIISSGATYVFVRESAQHLAEVTEVLIREMSGLWLRHRSGHLVIVQPLNRRVCVNHGSSRSVNLGDKELRLLVAMLSRFGNMVRTDLLLQEIWDIELVASRSTLSRLKMRVNEKLAMVRADLVIRSVRGVGYILVEM